MRKFKKIAGHLNRLGLQRFMLSSYRRIKKRIDEIIDRQLRMRGLISPLRSIHEVNWITMTFGLGGTEGANLLSEVFTEDERKRIFSDADSICKRRFSLLGSTEQDFSEAIPWHTDFKSGYTWPLSYYLDISRAIGDAQYTRLHADIKVPWELSRMQHLIPLGQAFVLSGNERYYEAFKTQTMDWIEQNPYKLGPNWASAMDVAIRAVNWTVACVYFKSSLDKDLPFSVLLLNHLKLTGEFIEENLECDFSCHGNNHYLANLTGLVFLGILLNKVPRAAKWLKIGMTGLEFEMQYQVNEDGGSFEGSLSYHRLSTEMFLFCAVVLRQNSLEFSEVTMKQIEKMCEFIQNYTKPNGKAPVIGDADDGRLLMMGNYCDEDKRDHRHLLGTAGFLFNRPDFFNSAGTELTEMKWFYGAQSFPVQPVSLPAYVAYPETGLYIYRDADLFLIIKCGPIGTKGKGGHDHNDQLSFELNIQGADIVIDPGTFAYTGDRYQRQLFRSVESHNVAQYANLEQNTIRHTSTAELFRMESAHGGSCIKAGLNNEGLYFEGIMQYEDSGVILRRSLVINTTAKTVAFQDVFEGSPSGGSQVERLHLSKDILDITLIGNNAQLKTTSGAVIPLTASANFQTKTCRISESYGLFYESVCLEWPMDQTSFFVFSY